MKYEKNLTPDELQDCKVAQLAKGAGKLDALLSVADRLNSGYVQPSIYNVKDFLERNRDYLLHQVGLDYDGKPLNTKKYKVLCHVVCTTEQEVEACSPDDAKEKANQLIWEDSDACALYIYRDDIRSASVVSCREEGRFEEVEYDDPNANRTQWLEERLAEAVNMLVQVKDGIDVDDVTASASVSGAGKAVDRLVSEVRAVYPRM